MKRPGHPPKMARLIPTIFTVHYQVGRNLTQNKSRDFENLTPTGQHHRHGSADSGHFHRAFPHQVAFLPFTSITKWGGT